MTVGILLDDEICVTAGILLNVKVSSSSWGFP